MTADDQADAVAVGERVGEAEIAFARHAIDEVDVVRFEALHQCAADRLCHRVPPGSVEERYSLSSRSRQRGKVNQLRQTKTAGGDTAGRFVSAPAGNGPGLGFRD